MSYIFYPFYWAKKDQWKAKYLIDNDDPLFRSFLQSGMGRVILTVRPGFEEAVNWYMATGQVWNGGQVPTLDDPMYLSIVDELQQTEGIVEGEWESRVPTSLTVIQAGTLGLEVTQSLPCDEDCHDFMQFDSDGNATHQSPFVQPTDEEGNPMQLGNVVEDVESLSESIEEIQTSIGELQADVDAIQESLSS